MHPVAQRAVGQVALQGHHHAGADQRAEHGADAAEQGHQDHLAGHVPVGVGQRGQLEHHGLGRPGQAGEGRRDDEGQQLVGVDVVAQRDRPRLVVADRLEHLAVGRVDGALDHREAEHEHRQHEVVHRQVARQVEQAEQVAARHALQTVLAAGERRLHEHEEHQLGQRQGDHREVDALAADRQEAEAQPEQPGGRRAGEDAQLGGQPRVLAEQVAGDVAAAGEERRVAERQQSGEAQQQVEGAGEQREAQQLHQEHRVHRQRGDQRQAQQRQVEAALAQQRRALALLFDLGVHGRSRLNVFQTRHAHASFPNSPAGRTSSTITITRKTTVLAASG
ncbi:hypothetical protein D3C85_412870 [compost metagenome]